MKHFGNLFILALSVTMFSCELLEPTGTCETTFINVRNSRLYLCNERISEGSCSGSESAFYKDKSCRDLGYNYLDSDGDWVYSSTSNTTPGPYGNWANGGTSGGSGVCVGTYVKISDAQLNSYCGAAYAYRCLQGKPLSDPSVRSVCGSYNSIKASGVPDCKYCK